MTLRIFLLILLSCTTSTHAITPLADKLHKIQLEISKNPNTSLQQIKETEKNIGSSAALELLYAQVYYALSYPGKAIEYAQSGLSKVKTTDPLYWRLKIALAAAHEVGGNAKLSHQILSEVFEWLEKYPDQQLKKRALYFRGFALNALGQQVPAMEDLLTALAMVSVNDTIANEGNIANGLALIHVYREESNLSVPYFESAVAYHRQHNNTFDLSIAIYGLGRAQIFTGNSSAGEASLREALALSEQLGDEQGVAYAYKELSMVKFKAERYEEALHDLIKAKEIFSKSKNNNMLFEMEVKLCRAYIELGQLTEARTAYENAKHIVKQNNVPIQELALDKLLAQLYEGEGNYQLAYESILIYLDNKTKQIVDRNTQQLQKLSSSFELEKKELQNQALEQTNAIQRITLNKEEARVKVLQISMIFSGVLILLLFLLYRNSSKNKIRLENLVNQDALTKALSRRKIFNQVENDLKRAVKPHCLVMLDLDNFKLTNDQFGHAVGDLVLINFVDIIQSTLNDKCDIGRIGGEEFLLNFPEQTPEKVTSFLAEIQSKFHFWGNENHIVNRTFSAGAVQVDKDADLAQLLRHADKLLYEAKANGKNQVIWLDTKQQPSR